MTCASKLGFLNALHRRKSRMYNRKGGEEEVANLLPLCGRFPSLDSRFLDARARRMPEGGMDIRMEAGR